MNDLKTFKTIAVGHRKGDIYVKLTRNKGVSPEDFQTLIDHTRQICIDVAVSLKLDAPGVRNRTPHYANQLSGHDFLFTEPNNFHLRGFKSTLLDMTLYTLLPDAAAKKAFKAEVIPQGCEKRIALLSQAAA